MSMFAEDLSAIFSAKDSKFSQNVFTKFSFVNTLATIAKNPCKNCRNMTIKDHLSTIA